MHFRSMIHAPICFVVVVVVVKDEIESWTHPFGDGHSCGCRLCFLKIGAVHFEWRAFDIFLEIYVAKSECQHEQCFHAKAPTKHLIVGVHGFNSVEDVMSTKLDFMHDIASIIWNICEAETLSSNFISI